MTHPLSLFLPLLTLLPLTAAQDSKPLWCLFGTPVCCSSTEAPIELTPATVEKLELNYLSTETADMQTNVGLGCKMVPNISDPCPEGHPIKFCCGTLFAMFPGYAVGCMVPIDEPPTTRVVDDTPPYEYTPPPDLPKPFVPQNPWDFEKDIPHDQTLCPVVPWLKEELEWASWADEDLLGDRWVKGGGVRDGCD